MGKYGTEQLVYKRTNGITVVVETQGRNAGKAITVVSDWGQAVMITQEIVQRALNAEDLEGLLQVGAPPDEYESEAEMIANAVAHTNEAELTEGRLADLIRDVWIEMFGPFSQTQIDKRSSGFQSAARRVLSECAHAR